MTRRQSRSVPDLARSDSRRARHRPDRPEGWINLATLAEAESRRGDAIAHYRKALALDPDYAPAKINLAQLAR
jgi:cytochrome c-type biogenesis protein CcmH/NrfG